MFQLWGMSESSVISAKAKQAEPTALTMQAAGQAASSAASPIANSAASDVVRGIMRLFARNGIWCLPEMPLRPLKSAGQTSSHRRADLMGIDAKGKVIIVEIKVQRGDLLGDSKWPDYLEHCDRFFWGVPQGLDRSPLESANYLPEECGVIVADGYDGEIVRPAPLRPLAAARRKVEIERLARAATRRLTVLGDPDCEPSF